MASREAANAVRPARGRGIGACVWRRNESLGVGRAGGGTRRSSRVPGITAGDREASVATTWTPNARRSRQRSTRHETSLLRYTYFIDWFTKPTETVRSAWERVSRTIPSAKASRTRRRRRRHVERRTRPRPPGRRHRRLPDGEAWSGPRRRRGLGDCAPWCAQSCTKRGHTWGPKGTRGRAESRAAIAGKPPFLAGFRASESGSPSRARTCDLRINSPPLYQLSYRGVPFGFGRKIPPGVVRASSRGGGW